MKKIKLLTSHEIQYIAAGEVIENWASIVKELVENSIDAKATHIIVRYDEERGILEIQDDGEGIDPFDLSLIFLPHATSKFDSLDTLFLQNKVFFGFRGEALAAISGVSKTEVISREPGSEVAYAITSLHGQISSVKEVAGNCGTVIRVSELFEHLGARKKYFQSKKQEQKNIFYVIGGLAVSHPQIAFSFYSQDKLMVHYAGKNTFIEKAKLLLCQPEDFYVTIDYSDEYLSLQGIMSKSSYGHYDRSRIYILANNRLVKQNNLLQPCIKPYYAENFVKRYPELFLHITVPADQIDINVHPRKEEVLFLYQRKIERILFQIIQSHLQKSSSLSLALDSRLSSVQIEHRVQKDMNHENMTSVLEQSTGYEKKRGVNPSSLNGQLFCPSTEIVTKSNTESITKASTEIKIEKKMYDINSNAFLKVKPFKTQSLFSGKSDGLLTIDRVDSNNSSFAPGSFIDELIRQKNNHGGKLHSTQKQIPYPSVFDLSGGNKKTRENLYANSDNKEIEGHRKDDVIMQRCFSGKYVGTIKNTYLILLNEKSLVCVDQHALHEKILYEKYVQDFLSEKMLHQPLLFPESERLTLEEADFFKKEKELFSSIGIQYVFDGECIFVTDVPPLFIKGGGIDLLRKSMSKLIEKTDDAISKKKEIIIHETAALYGCKNAVKAGDVLTTEEIESLFDQAQNLQNASFCPHGRPIYYELSASQLDTLCKRT